MSDDTPDLFAFDPATAPCVGSGASAEVFALGPALVVKLMRPGIPASLAARELAATRAAFDAGVPVPEPHGLVEAAGRAGLVLARLHEGRWLRRARRWPGPVMATLAGMARHQAEAHRVAVPAGLLPDAHTVLAARIATSQASPRAVAAALAALARLPRGDRLGHGDLHFGNLLTTPKGTYLLDWAQAMAGDPAADVARSELVMRFGRYGALMRRYPWLRPWRDAAAAWYLHCYRAITGIDAAAIDAWRLPVAVAWLRDGSAAHLPALRAYVERRLARETAGAAHGLTMRPGRIQFD